MSHYVSIVPSLSIKESIMDNNIFRIGMISSSKTLLMDAQKIAFEKNIDIDCVNLGLHDAISAAKNMKKSGIEVILAKGITFSIISNKVNIPVLSIPRTAFDIIKSLSHVSSLGKRILLFSHKKYIKDIDIAKYLFNIKLDQIVFYEIDDLKQLLHANKNKYDVFIGGHTLVNISLQFGLNAVEINCSHEAISTIIDNAISVANFKRKEQQESQRYYQILNAVSEGIISIDRSGTIMTLNDSAASLLKTIPSELIGKNINTLFPLNTVLDVINEKIPLNNKIVKINNENFIFNHVPIIFNKESLGVVSTFKNISNVINVENRVRKLFAKGFVAKYNFDDFIYNSKQIKDVIRKAKKFAQTNSTILINGETGTGKEILAHSIHNYSLRNKKPFISINCAVLPEQLLESELFGYEDGAFTGSKKGGKLGLFEICQEGTIFLDEIGSTTQKVQTNLLRVLQEKEFMRIGADRIISIDVRVIAATNKNLINEVQANKFREDLYFRLNVLNISLPPLRNRIDDIPLLIHKFIKVISKENNILPLDMPKQFYKNLKDYSWPGNIRQLKNFAEKLVILCGSNFNLEIFEELFYDLTQYSPSPSHEKQIESDDVLLMHRQPKIRNFLNEEKIIFKALEDAKFKKNIAANKLGISRTTLWRKLRTYAKITN